MIKKDCESEYLKWLGQLITSNINLTSIEEASKQVSIDLDSIATVGTHLKFVKFCCGNNRNAINLIGIANTIDHCPQLEHYEVDRMLVYQHSIRENSRVKSISLICDHSVAPNAFLAFFMRIKMFTNISLSNVPTPTVNALSDLLLPHNSRNLRSLTLRRSSFFTAHYVKQFIRNCRQLHTLVLDSNSLTNVELNNIFSMQNNLTTLTLITCPKPVPSNTIRAILSTHISPDLKTLNLFYRSSYYSADLYPVEKLVKLTRNIVWGTLKKCKNG